MTTSRRLAIAKSKPTYFGKVCTKHPELHGERRRRSCACVGCHKERSAVRERLKYATDPEYRKRKAEARRKRIPAVQRAAAGTSRYFGGVCIKHPELYGERYYSGYVCIACHRERAKARRTRKQQAVTKAKD